MVNALFDANYFSQRKDSEKSDDQMSINSLEWSEYETDSSHTNEENDNLDAGHECSSKIADNKVQPSLANFTEDNSNTTTTLDAESTSNEIPKQKWTRNFSTGDIVWAKWGKWEWLPGIVTSKMKDKLRVRFFSFQGIYAISSKINILHYKDKSVEEIKTLNTKNTHMENALQCLHDYENNLS
ncbi:hypothetical protein TKK_0001645 [Trichogramma kaykai]